MGSPLYEARNQYESLHQVQRPVTDYLFAQIPDGELNEVCHQIGHAHRLYEEVDGKLVERSYDQRRAEMDAILAPYFLPGDAYKKVVAENQKLKADLKQLQLQVDRAKKKATEPQGTKEKV